MQRREVAVCLAGDEGGVAKKEIGKPMANSLTVPVPSGPIPVPMSAFVSKRKIGVFLCPAGEPKKILGLRF
jgi:hypothetical protein